MGLSKRNYILLWSEPLTTCACLSPNFAWTTTNQYQVPSYVTGPVRQHGTAPRWPPQGPNYIPETRPLETEKNNRMQWVNLCHGFHLIEEILMATGVVGQHDGCRCPGASARPSAATTCWLDSDTYHKYTTQYTCGVTNYLNDNDQKVRWVEPTWLVLSRKPL